MLGENALTYSLGNQSQPRLWPRPGGALSVTWTDEQTETRREAAPDPRANLREALSQSFRCSLFTRPKGLSGDFVQVLTRLLRAEARPAVERRTRELRWRQNNEQLLEALAGQWLVVEGDELIAHGRDPVTLVTAAKRRGIQVPFVFFVEPRTHDTVKIGL
jgi:hypothetical protein